MCDYHDTTPCMMTSHRYGEGATSWRRMSTVGEVLSTLAESEDWPMVTAAELRAGRVTLCGEVGALIFEIPPESRADNQKEEAPHAAVLHPR